VLSLMRRDRRSDRSEVFLNAFEGVSLCLHRVGLECWEHATMGMVASRTGER
jgi:hypothetical protein